MNLIMDWFEQNWHIVNVTALSVIAIVAGIWLSVRKRHK